jgi:signal transduction histidine kinase
MTSKRSTTNSSFRHVGDRHALDVPSGSSADTPSSRVRGIDDLDIETTQWLSDDQREGFALYDAEDRLVIANAEFIRLHSPAADILKPGMTFEAMIRTMVLRGAMEAPVGGEEEFIAERVRLFRGTKDPFLRRFADGSALIIRKTFLSDGSVICRANDVSAIIESTGAQEEAGERFKELAEIASDWFWETDENHRICSMTLPARLSMASADDLIGLTRWEIVGADPVNDPHWAQHKADLDGRRPFREFHYSFVPPTGMSTHFRVSGSAVFNKSGLALGYRSMPSDDGGRRHFAVSGVPVFDKDGNFRGYRGTSREITKEVLSERRAAAAHQRLLDAIEALPESFILCDAEDRIVLCNSATYTRLPWCKTLLEPGMKYEDALREIAYSGAVTARGREEEWIEKTLARHHAAAGIREYKRKDGRWVRITERRTADGGMVMIRADITDEKQAELELEAALTQVREENRAKSTFLANLIHELHVPMDRIAHLSRELEDKVPGELGDAQREVAKAIREVAAQTTRLLGDVLDLSRIQVRKYKLTPTDIDVAALIADCCAAANGDRKRSKIAAEVAPDVGIVRADEPTMRHLLLNIIGDVLGGNSTSAMVRIAAAAVDDRVEISIHDQSADLSGTDLESAMRPFRDVDAGEKTFRHPHTKGFGIGLAIAGALAREIGAILSVTAPPEGGIRVIVTMPRTSGEP